MEVLLLKETEKIIWTVPPTPVVLCAQLIQD